MLLGKNGGNILNMYSKGDIVITMGRAGLVSTLLLSFPLLTHPCRATIEVLLFDKFWEASSCRSIFISTLISVSSYLIAIFVPNITVVWTLTGSTDAIIVAYVLPALFYLKLTKGSICNRKLPAAFLFVVGVGLSIVCTFASIVNVIKIVKMDLILKLHDLYSISRVFFDVCVTKHMFLYFIFFKNI